MIGEEWDISKPEKPVAEWDPDANIVIPLGITAWLSQLGVAYGSHSIITADPLQCVNQGLHAAGTIGVRMALSGAPYKRGQKYPFTIRLVGDDNVTQDDRTLWLKIKDR